MVSSFFKRGVAYPFFGLLFSSFVGVPVYFYIPSGVIFFILNKGFLRKKNVFLFLFLFSIVILNYFYYCFIGNRDDLYHPVITSIINNIIGKFIIIVNAVFLYVFLKQKPILFLSMIKAVLTLNLVVFFIQFFCFIILNKYIDFSGYLFGEAARGDSGASGSLYWGLPRFTGLYIEPSHYGVSIGFLVLSCLCIEGLKDRKIIGVALLSMILSMSSASIYMAAVILGFAALQITSSRMWIYSFILIVCVIVVFHAHISNIIDYQLYRLSYSSDIRFNFIEKIFSRDGLINYFGTSIFSIERDVYFDKLFSESRLFSSEKDSGSLIYAMARFGWVGLICYLVLGITFLRKSAMAILVFLMVSVTKITFEEPLFWILYFSILFYSEQKYLNKRCRDVSLQQV